MKRTKWIARKLAQINSGEAIPEADIRGMRTIIRTTLNNDCATEADKEGMHLVAEAVYNREPAVTYAQARKGAAWLYAQAFTPRGVVRKTEFAQALTAHDLNVIRECYAAPRFQLVELEFCEYGRYLQAVFPVYRCHGADGRSFDYSARAWQAGGNSFVIHGSRRYGAML